MTPLGVSYGDLAQAQAALQNPHLLAVVQYADALATDPTHDPRWCQVALPPLAAQATSAEIWLGSDVVHRGVRDGVEYASDGQVAWLQVHLPEVTAKADALQALTRRAYQSLIAAARAVGYPHFLRIWNYFPAINQECGGLERYRAFCAGRHQALTDTQQGFETRLPAATAIGSASGGLQILALAARTPGLQVENPRQVSAFRYPPQYGPRSPTFSRALLKAWGEGLHHLYISGTASIAGHASQHDTLLAQLDEILMNLRTLLVEANRRAGAPLAVRLLKVYIRTEPDDLNPMRTRLAEAFGAVPVLFLHGAICRQELLIEIEGLATSGLPCTQEAAAL